MNDITAPKRVAAHRDKRAGFSLVELMVVILILGILGSFAALKLMSKGDEAKVAKAIHDIDEIAKAVKMFYLKQNRLPEALDELAGEFEDDEVPLDPWDNQYIFTKISKREFDIISLGADGEEGGEELDEDLNRGSKKKKRKKE